MRYLLVGLTLASLFVPPGMAQQAQSPQMNLQNAAPPPPAAQQQPPGRQGTIRVTVDLVLIDVQVTDRNGKPLKGLKKEQFVVTEDDKPQKISSLDFHDIEAMEVAAEPNAKPIVISLAPTEPEEKIRQAVQDHRLLVLFLDATAMQPEDLLRARDACVRFVKQQMSPADLVSVVSFGNRLTFLSGGFTNDRGVLLRGLARLQPGKEAQLAGEAVAAPQPGEVDVTEYTAAAFTQDETEFNIFNTDRKLEALESLSDVLHSIPGRKSVIYFTGGIAQTGDENLTELRAATDAANRSNATFYSVDARALMADIPGGAAELDTPSALGKFSGSTANVSRRATGGAHALFSGKAISQQNSLRQNSRETLATLSADTGGKAFFDVGDFGDAFRRIQAENSDYYLLGYYSSDGRRDGRWRRVKVHIEGVPGARLHYREGYYAPTNGSLLTPRNSERQLEEAMREDKPRVEFPVALETDSFRLNNSEFFVPLTAKISSNALEWAQKRGKHEVQFDFATEVRDVQSNRIVSALRDSIRISLATPRFQQVQSRALLYQGGVILPPGRYRLKFLAREDETGRIGTFEEDLKLPAPQLARLELSSVLLSSQVETTKNSSEVKRSTLGPNVKLKTTPLDVPGAHIVPSVTRVFTTEQQLMVFFQAYLPANVDGSKLRAGLVFFHNGEQFSESPLTPPSDLDTKTRIASFRVELPLEKFPAGRYSVQAIAVNAAGEQAAFGRNYFAVRLPSVEGGGTSAGTGKQSP